MNNAITRNSTGAGRFAGAAHLPAVGAPGAEPPADVALRAAECALVERRLGARDPVETLYLEAHSLLRSLRRHLAVLDARDAA